MAQFDVYRLAAGDIVIDVQSDQFSHFATRVVVPLFPADSALRSGERLNPVLRIGEEEGIMMTQMMLAVPTNILRSRIASLASDYLRIEAAIDTLTGSY